MKRSSIYALVLAAFAVPASARILVYPHSDFLGPSLAIDNVVGRAGSVELNRSDRAASVIVEGEAWKACESPRYGGLCVILPRGAYQTPAAMGLDHRIASLRVAEVRPDDEAPFEHRPDYR
jgi:Beta/Gamma crystallin